MSDLIDEFRKEHESIMENLVAVKRLGVHTMEGRNHLMAAKGLLLEHLEKEDLHLYPELDRAASTDTDLKEMLDSLESELRDITRFSSYFFEKYTLGGSMIEFLRDFEKLKNTLERRITKEEELLYTKYSQLHLSS